MVSVCTSQTAPAVKVVLGRGFFTGDLIGAVFAIGEVFRHRATRAAVGEGKYRSAGCAGIGKAVGVNRHKQIGAVLVGNFHAVVQRDKGIARTRQARVNTVIAQDAAYVLAIASTTCFSLEPL